MNILEEGKKILKEYETTKDKEVLNKLKRNYTIYRTEQRYKGNISENTINNLYQEIISNYKELKQFKAINETIQMMTDDLEFIADNDKTKRDGINRNIFNINQNILGNPGASIKDVSKKHMRTIVPDGLLRTPYEGNLVAAYTDIIIRHKLGRNGINSNDLISLLKDAYSDVYEDINGYQRLIEESTILDIIDDEIKNKTQDITNIEILDVLSDLAKSYKMKLGSCESAKDYTEMLNKVLDIYKRGNELTQFDGTEQYAKIKENYETFSAYAKFRRVEISSINDLEKVVQELLNEIGINSSIFQTGTRNINPDPDPTPSQKPNQMSAIEKLSAIKELVEQLRKEYPNIDIKQVMVGTEKYSGYIIMPLYDTNISLFEKFKDNINEATYIIKNDDVNQAVLMTKPDVKQHFDVETVNHVCDTRNGGYKNYLFNLIQKTRSMISRTSSPNKEGKLQKQLEIKRMTAKERFEERQRKAAERQKEQKKSKGKYPDAI